MTRNTRLTERRTKGTAFTLWTERQRQERRRQGAIVAYLQGWQQEGKRGGFRGCCLYREGTDGILSIKLDPFITRPSNTHSQQHLATPIHNNT
jgi:hypothetical protein